MTIRRLLLQRFTRLVTSGYGAHPHVQGRFLDRTKKRLETLLHIDDSALLSTNPNQGTLEERKEFDLWWKDFERECKTIVAQYKK